ncbi:MAG: sugar phosphate isomerase/epimerase [Planctomycetota bacterium]|nr:sugar phosphate isomerase/epimerase [Planctomycetota bacterium]
MYAIGLREFMLTKTGLEFVDEAKALGCDAIEPVVKPGGESDAWGGRNGRAALRKRAENLGVAIPSICLGCLNAIPLAGPEAALQAHAAELLRAGIDWASELGAGAILVPFFGKAQLRDADDRARLAEELARLAPRAEAAGVSLAVESTLPAARVLEILEAVNSPRVGCYWDTGNAAFRDYDAREEIPALAARLVMVHLKDTIPAHGDVHLGEGRVNFPRVAFDLARAGYRHPLILETPRTADPVASARRNLAFARGIFNAGSAFA